VSATVLASISENPTSFSILCLFPQGWSGAKASESPCHVFETVSNTARIFGFARHIIFSTRLLIFPVDLNRMQAAVATTATLPQSYRVLVAKGDRICPHQLHFEGFLSKGGKTTIFQCTNYFLWFFFFRISIPLFRGFEFQTPLKLDIHGKK
jgi:hypothetical protein